MNYIEVKKGLKEEFESLLKPIGYKSKLGNQGCDFYFSEPELYRKIGFGIAKYEPVFYTGVYIYVGIDMIDKILSKILDFEYSKSIGGGGTLSSSTSIYFNELNYRYEIKTLEDIKEWGKIVRKFYEEYAVPFFEKYNSVDTIDKLLNDNPTEKVIYCDDMGWRIIKGLIAAKLNNNPKYNDLRDYYFGFIVNANQKLLETKNRGYFMYDKCMKTIDFLETHNQEELLKIANA
jgi:hypothetical protein